MAKDEFAFRWINNILESVNEHLDEDTKVRLMESCGRACARSGVIDSAVVCQGDLDKFLSTMGKWVGKKNVSREGDAIQVIYEKCYCRLKTQVPVELSDTYCSCSSGWLKEMFETVVGKPVDVEIESTINRGAEKCRFLVNL